MARAEAPSPAAADGVEARLLFLISAPRSGSTLLMRILHATTSVHGMPEAHLLPPLAHLGPWRAVQRAPYDALQAQQAQRELLDRLPEGRDAWFDAARAYTDHIYGRLLETEATGARYLLDKTPANALVLPVLRRLYPRAHYLVLTRHPAAIACSHADRFFAGDHAAAERFNPVLARYLPAIARFLRQPPAHLLHLDYADLVQQPRDSLRRISRWLEIPFEPQALDYQRASVPPGRGDPGVDEHQRPVTDSLHRWTARLQADPTARTVVHRQVHALDPRDLATWGHPLESLWQGAPGPPPRRSWSRAGLQRRLLLALRRDIDRRPHGRWLRHLRDACEVLLRGS